MPIQFRRYLLGFLWAAIAALVYPVHAQLAGDENEKLQAEVAAVRESLQQHPKFEKYYEHLAANPDSLPVNGPKLAVLLAAEAKTNAAIKDHTPSLLATWQEVMRLAAAGNDYKTSFPAIDSLQKHPSGLLTPAAARLAKGKLLAAVAEMNVAKPVPGEREALLALVRGLLTESMADYDVESLPALLTADAKLSWSTVESANSIQLLLPLAEQAGSEDRLAAAKLLFAHLDGLVLKTAAGKARKDFTDAIAAARERLTIAEAAEQAQQTLATKPLDPAANQAYGMYLLTHRGQWRESLTYLALGNDPEWKKLAAASLETTAAAEKVTLADSWSALAKEEHAPSKELARHLYQESLADKALVGIARAAAEEKLKALGEPPMRPSTSEIITSRKPLPLNEWVDLLPLVDFDQDLVRGFFAKGPRNSIFMGASPNSRIRLPALLADCSYDLVVEFNAGAKANDVHVLLPIGKHCVCLVVDGYAGGDTCHFDGLQKTAPIRKNLLQPNQVYRYEINVRLKDDRASVTFSLNGNKILEDERPVSAIQSSRDYFLETHSQPGLAGFQSAPLFGTCQVRALSGEPKIGRDVPLFTPIPASIMALKPTRLVTLRPLSATAYNDFLGVSTFPKGLTGWLNPILGGEECRDFVLAHAPSALSYAIPPNTKYFTAIAHCAQNPGAKFIVKVDGKELHSVERKVIAPVFVEIPEGAKVLQLECDSLGDHRFDHTSWCFLAFRS